MKKEKQLLCSLTGEPIAKRGSVLVANQRVKKELAFEAEMILVKSVDTVLVNYLNKPNNARNRLSSLVMACCVIKHTQEVFKLDPSAFIVEIARKALENDKPVNMTFMQKLLDFADGKVCYELTTPKARKAFELGYSVLFENLKPRGSNE